jgi:DMSO/TMAO reductase YedYZ molybdopterin-dependent catalytic subunit
MGKRTGCVVHSGWPIARPIAASSALWQLHCETTKLPREAEIHPGFIRSIWRCEMKMSRRETIQLSATALAALSLAAVRPSALAAQTVQAQPDGLVDAKLRAIAPLPLAPDGSAIEYKPQDAGSITGVLWRTKNQTPDGEFDYRKMKIKLDARGTATLSGTLTFGDLEKLSRQSYVTLLQCGAPAPHGIVKWTGVRFSDFARAVGAQPFASYARFIGSDSYVIDEDFKTLMHPQVMLAWLLNDQPIPPENGAPLRLVVPFRYGARSLKAIREIQFTATSFPAPSPA